MLSTSRDAVLNVSSNCGSGGTRRGRAGSVAVAACVSGGGEEDSFWPSGVGVSGGASVSVSAAGSDVGAGAAAGLELAGAVSVSACAALG